MCYSRFVANTTKDRIELRGKGIHYELFRGEFKVT
jgi:hypothetical protein